MITTHRDPWVYSLLGEHNFQRQKGFLSWWYWLTLPPDPGATATLKQRDLALRSNILSALALFFEATLVIVAYIALSGPNRQIITTVCCLVQEYPIIGEAANAYFP